VLLQGFSRSGAFATANFPAIPGRLFQVNYLSNQVTLQVIPEPDSMCLIGLAAMALRTRRRSRRAFSGEQKRDG
jgi:hypothetical protein